MKRIYIVLTIVICAVFVVSCKNSGSSKQTQNVQIEASQKEDSLLNGVPKDVMSTIDDYCRKYVSYFAQCDELGIILANMKESHKKGDTSYLLDPSLVGSMVTRAQKINALAVYSTQFPFRVAFGLPLEEARGAIAKLISELDHPVTMQMSKENTSAALIDSLYQSCKAQGRLDYFCEFNFAVHSASLYLVSKYADLFFKHIDDTQYMYYSNRCQYCTISERLLSKYNEEIAKTFKIYSEMGDKFGSWENAMDTYRIKEKFWEYVKHNVEQYAARQAELLK